MSKRSSSFQPQRTPPKLKRKYSLFSSSSRLHTLASKYDFIPSFVEKMLSISTKATIDCPQADDNEQAPDFKWIKGRRFQSIAGVEYVLPNDKIEQERLHSEHLMLTFAFQGLFSAPVADLLTAGARVLDIGCGPGGWVLDMAKNYPRSYFVGIDISDQFPTEPLLRTNAEFSVANAVEKLPFPDESFDYIHQRLLSFSLTTKQWDNVMSEIHRLLKPGGYVELTELDCDFQRWGSWGQRATESFHSYIRSRGIEPSVARHLPTLMTRAQLSPKHTSYISMPLGRWGGKLGVLFADDVLKAIRAMEALIVGGNVGMSLEDFSQMCKSLMDEWEQCQSFANYFKCYGRKEPL